MLCLHQHNTTTQRQKEEVRMMHSLWVSSRLPVVKGVIAEGAPGVGDVAAGAHKAHHVGVQAQPSLQIHLSPAMTQPHPQKALTSRSLQSTCSVEMSRRASNNHKRDGRCVAL